MVNQNPQEQAMADKIAVEATAPPVNLISRVKAGMAEMSSRQTIKLTLLALALIVWYPIYRRLDPFSRWVAYDLFRIVPGSHLGESVAFSSWTSPRSSCCCS